MAPLAARLASARAQARRAPIRVTAIERELGTRYTVDTLRKLRRRYPKQRFVWLMGADNLAQFTAGGTGARSPGMMPIAVIARPGYDAALLRAPRWPGSGASGVRQRNQWTGWSAPALVFLRFDPDPRSATAIRRADPDWFDAYAGRAVRDGVTHRILR